MAIPNMMLLQVATMLGANGNVRILDSVDQSDTCYIKKNEDEFKKEEVDDKEEEEK